MCLLHTADESQAYLGTADDELHAPKPRIGDDDMAEKLSWPEGLGQVDGATRQVAILDDALHVVKVERLISIGAPPVD